MLARNTMFSSLSMSSTNLLSMSMSFAFPFSCCNNVFPLKCWRIKNAIRIFEMCYCCLFFWLSLLMSSSFKVVWSKHVLFLIQNYPLYIWKLCQCTLYDRICTYLIYWIPLHTLALNLTPANSSSLRFPASSRPCCQRLYCLYAACRLSLLKSSSSGTASTSCLYILATWRISSSKTTKSKS